MRARRRGRRGRLLVGLVLSLVLTACQERELTYDEVSTSSMHTKVLTPDAFDHYEFSSRPGGMSVTAPATNTSGNLRMAFWPAQGPSVVDSESCATWASESGGLAQQGVALRMRIYASGRTRLLTVTRNVWRGGSWIFNFHTWDSAQQPPYTLLGSVSLDGLLRPGGQLAPLPWHVCGRAVGNRLDVKVWLDGQAEPGYADRSHGGGVALPAGWAYPGKAGWYIGHLQPGASARFERLATYRFVSGETGSTTTTTVGPTTVPLVPLGPLTTSPPP